MGIVNGLYYNLKGLSFALKARNLLLWGAVRFLVVVILTVGCAGLVLMHRREVLDMVWHQPDSPWIRWLWHVFSWALSLILVGLSALLAYLASQILFSVIIMDRMSRITEQMVTGMVQEPRKVPFFRLALFLVKQEVPRAVIPLFISFSLMITGWFVPFGSVLMVLSWAATAVFLAWDNTDLVPSRRLVPLGDRLRILRRSIPFHLGFGLPFLVPGINALFLAFAPVGATLYHVESLDRNSGHAGEPGAGLE